MLIAMSKYLFKSIVVMIFLCAWQNSVSQDFNGTWRYSNNYISIEIELQQFGNNVTGTHCIIYGVSGDSIDCCEEGKSSIHGNVTQNCVNATIESYYSGYFGEVNLILESNNSLVWKLIKMPKDVFFYPKSVTLTKDKNAFTNPKVAPDPSNPTGDPDYK